MPNYNSEFEKQFEGFSKVSKAVEAQDDSQFEELSFSLRRTKSNNVYSVGRPSRGQTTQTQRRFSYNDKFSYQAKNDSIHIVSIPVIPIDFLSIKDDNNLLLDKPDRFIDYLSFNWEIWDLLMTWKFILKWKQFLNSEYVLLTKGIKNLESIIRLENIIWRLYFKLQSKEEVDIDKMTHRDQNWFRNNELCWLYGPLILYDNDPNTKHMTTQKTEQSRRNTRNGKYFPSQIIKPILKKEKTDKILLNNSLWKLKQLRIQMNSEGSNTSPVSECCSSTSSNSIISSASRSFNSPLLPDIPKITSILKNSHPVVNKPIDETRHITFNDTVTQCMPISTAVSRESLLTIRYISNTKLNILPGSDSEEPEILKESATVSHNVKTLRNYTYKYGYDYNSVYTKNIDDYMTYTPFLVDTKDPIEKETIKTGKEDAKVFQSELTLSTPKYTHYPPNPSKLRVTKTRNFITGDIIESSDNSISTNEFETSNSIFTGFHDSSLHNLKDENTVQSPSILVSPPSTTSLSSSSNSLNSSKPYNMRSMPTFQLSSSDDDDSDKETGSNKSQKIVDRDMFFTSSQYLE
ncbi:hypothetical protein MOSE0_J01970 [Monosporozyma servazzii]